MSKKVRLVKDLCDGGGLTVKASSEDLQFRLVTCPLCRRQNLSAMNPRHEVVADHGSSSFGERTVVTIPPHRARAIFSGQPKQKMTPDDDYAAANYQEYLDHSDSED